VFIGHFALGFAAKRIAPRTSLGTLFAAAEFADILFPILVLLGWESAGFVSGTNPFLALKLDRYPISHGLLALIAWGVVVALLYQWRRDYARGAVVVALLVVSHWVLDFITHRPDMPLYPGGAARVGLGLWSSTAGTIVVEGLLFVAGVWLYARATRARDRVGSWALWGLVAFLALSYLGDLFSSARPDPAVFAWVGLLMGWLLVVWAWWVDRHREVRSEG
jgi:hypothetical protein